MMPTEKDESTSRRRLWNRIGRGLVFLPQALSRALILPFRLMAKQLRLEKLSRRQSAWAALVLFVVSTVVAYRQFRQPYHSHEPYSEFSTSWWLHPAEWNTEAALPAITGNIKAVLKAENGGRLWIAGDNGLLAYSTDQGDSWILMEFDGIKFVDPTATPTPLPIPLRNPTTTPTPLPTATPTVSPTPAATPRASPERKSAPMKKALLRLDLVPAAYAAELSGDKKPLQTPTPNPAAQLPPTNQTSGGGSDGRGGQNYVSQSTPTELIAKPSRLDFGPVQVGASKSASFSIIYARGTIPADALSFLQPVSDFGITKNDCLKLSLRPGSACEVTIRFAPLETGKFNSEVVFGGGLSSSLRMSVPLSGVGVNQPSSPSPSPVPIQPPDLTDLFDQGKNIVARSAAAFYTLRTDDGSWLPSSASKDLKLDTVPWPWPRDTTPRAIRLNVAGGAQQQQKVSLSTLTNGARESSLSSATNEIAFDSDGKQGWLVGSSGVIFRTYDGGAHWYPATQSARARPITVATYQRFFPPWYWLSVALCLVLLAPLLAPSVPQEEPKSLLDWVFVDKPPVLNQPPPDRPEPSIANKAVSDKPLEPGEPDALGLGAIAAGLAFFLRNDQTKPPLALGISGRWGSGKSSLMNLLKKDLEDSGSQPVWFNAWHHQKEEQLLAALLQAVKTQAVPPWSQWEGWGFRARLALIRLQHYWLRVALVAAALFLLGKAENFFVSNNLLSSLSALNLPKDTPLITTFTGVLAVLKALVRGLTAFGTNPASLLTTMSGGTKVKDLDAQTSFRQRFAEEFADVTRALGRRHRMLILIDDLDRCRPEKVREVLEAVNFLVSSGDCFIVLGMARDIVEHCVGLSFRRVVDTLSWDSMGLSQEEMQRFISEAKTAEAQGAGAAQPGTQAVSSDVAAKRRAFARLYLDKLIQIEVAVPEPTFSQRRLLFQTDEDNKKKSEPELRVEQILKWSGNANLWLAPVAQAALAALILIGAGLLAGRYAGPPIQHYLTTAKATPSGPGSSQGSTSNSATSDKSASKTLAAGSTDGANQGTTSNAASDAPPKPSLSPTATPTATPAGTPSPQPSPQIASGAANAALDWLSFWPLYLVGLIVMGAASSALRRVPQRDVTDTDVFVNALGIWHPLVMTCGAKNTPRTARRFQNRVRYLAMRQRALSQARPQSPIERWLRKRLKAELPIPAPLLALPESEPLPKDLLEDSERIRELVENGKNDNTKYWKVKHSASGVEISAGSESAPLSLDRFQALMRSWIYIPEPLLVALTAIEEYEPQWLAEEADFNQHVVEEVENLKRLIEEADSNQHVVDRVEDLKRLNSEFFEAVKKHLKVWPGWCNMSLYRKAYLQLTSEPQQIREPRSTNQPAQSSQKQQADQLELPKPQPQPGEPQPGNDSPEKGSAASAS